MTNLNVFLDGTYAGELSQNDAGLIRFRYDETYRQSGDSYPLSTSMPLVVPEHSGQAVRAYLAGLLPDRDETLLRWGREFSVSPRNPFALLKHVGRDAAGAVQILPSDEDPEDARDRNGLIKRLSNEAVGEILRSLAMNADDWDPGKYGGRWSLAGAQSKIALYRDDDGWGIPEDSTPTTHILKPAPERFTNHEINEQVTMTAARLMGMPTASSSLVPFPHAGNVFVSQRYDRIRLAGRWSRLHQEDFCQALAKDPSQKYQSDGGPGVADVAKVIERFPDQGSRAVAVRQFFEALVFNVATGATDGHAKNFSILITAKAISLAPLYDMATILHYESTDNMRSAMKIGDHWKMNQIVDKDWSAVARKLRIPQDEAIEAVRRIQAGVPDAFFAAAQTMPDEDARGRAETLADSIERYSTSRGRSARSVEAAAAAKTGLSHLRSTSEAETNLDPRPGNHLPDSSGSVWVPPHLRHGRPVNGYFRARRHV